MFTCEMHEENEKFLFEMVRFHKRQNREIDLLKNSGRSVKLKL